MSIIDIKNLSYCYPRHDYEALCLINLQIEKGEFCAITGRSGCGKSTLLRALGRLIPDFYGGTLSGEIFLQDRLLMDWNAGELYRKIGVIIQEAEHSIIFDTVERDIAFGLENLGLDNDEMRKRVHQILDYFYLSKLSQKPISHLSGGEKQKVALAGILAMKPEVLILDEPTAQLDPGSARDFMQLIKRLHKELGITIIMAEQRLNMLLAMADKTLIMEAGKIIFSGTPIEQKNWAENNNYPLQMESVQKGTTGFQKSSYFVPASRENNIAAAVQGLDFYYEVKQPVLENIDLTLYHSQITALTGGNGAGKTTLMKILLGLLKPGKGQIKVLKYQGSKLVPRTIGRDVAYLPQNLDHFFITDTVLEDVMMNLKITDKREAMARSWLERLDVLKYADQDPRSLSTGEKQRAALAAVLAGNPSLILLDEPTRGLDIFQKRQLGKILSELAAEGKAILLSTHDTEFVRVYAHRILNMLQGRITADKNTAEESTEAV